MQIQLEQVDRVRYATELNRLENTTLCSGGSDCVGFYKCRNSQKCDVKDYVRNMKPVL